MTPSIPFAWIGTAGLNTAGEDAGSSGPIGQAVQDRAFNRIILLSDYTSIEEQRYCSWLKTKTLSEIVIMHHDLSSPMYFGEIYEAARGLLDQNRQEADQTITSTYRLSSGTSALAAVWILLAKTSHPAELIQSSVQQGVQTVSFPFDLPAAAADRGTRAVRIAAAPV